MSILNLSYSLLNSAKFKLTNNSVQLDKLNELKNEKNNNRECVLI